MLPPRLRNSSIVMPCLVVIAIMLGLVAYSPTLYRLFCAATGYGGTTQRVDFRLQHNVQSHHYRAIR